jgi:alkylhydroperoxidase/carboxymuconolactone decarboxylase family protein YurZ
MGRTDPAGCTMGVTTAASRVVRRRPTRGRWPMSVDKLTAEMMQSLAGDDPIMETLVRMNLDLQQRSGLDDRTYVLVRLAALVALDGPAASYLVNFAAADEVGITLDDVRGVLIALSPIVGTARTVAATERATRAINEAQRI